MTHSAALGCKATATLGLLYVMLMGSACQDANNTVLSPSADAPLSAVSGAQLLSLIENAEDQYPLPGDVRFPADFMPHPQYLSESFSLRAVLDVPDQPDKLGVVVQFDRLSLPAKKSPLDVRASAVVPAIAGAGTQFVNQVARSDWEFTGLMRSAITIDGAEQDVSQRESIQRIALDLAGHDETGFWVGSDRLNINIEEPCRPAYTLRVRTADNQFLRLRWRLPACPESEENGLFNRWSSVGVKLSGVIGRDSTGKDDLRKDDLRSVTGLGFVSQAYGNLEFTTGAVVFDRLQLLVTDARGKRFALSLFRSKRRSGRGPRAVTATLMPLDTSTRRADTRRLTVSWTDRDTRWSSESGFAYPATIRLDDSSGEFDILLTPMHGMTEINDAFGTRLQEAVRVSGTHQGVGYLDYIPLE